MTKWQRQKTASKRSIKTWRKSREESALVKKNEKRQFLANFGEIVFWIKLLRFEVLGVSKVRNLT